MDKYVDLDLNKLVLLSRERDDSAFAELLKRYSPMMNKVIASFSESGASRDSLFAEATVALHTAVLRFDLEQTDVTFGLFAKICIQHRLIDFLRKEDAEPRLVELDVETIVSEDELEEGILSRERFEKMLKEARRSLSEYEYSVLLLHIQGYKTAAIASKLNKDSKSVDNAKSRIFRRLRGAFGSGAEF